MRKNLLYITGAFVAMVILFAIFDLIPTAAHAIDGQNGSNSHSHNELSVTEGAYPTFIDEAKVTTYVEKDGPFVINSKIFTIVMAHKKLSRDDTIESFEIVDENNRVHYKKHFGATIAEGHPDFESTVQMKAYKVSGSSGEGLIIYYTLMPNAPPAGESFQFFGLKKGLLKPLTLALGIAGDIHKLPNGDSERTVRLLEGDLIEVQIWTNYFAVIIPISVDLKRLRIAPAKSSGTFDIYYPFPDLLKSPEELRGRKIRLYPSHDSNLKAEDVALEGVKEIGYSCAYADIELKTYEYGDKIEVSNLWLKINLDGKEGWINGSDSFHELGFYGL